MAIQDLLQHPDLWRAGQLRAVQAIATTPSGFAALDAHLPGNGWPEAGLMEFMLATSGIGELKLLAPALQHLSRQARWIAWINPPFIPYAPALSALGIDISKILLIHPKSHEDALWALERASKSGTCSVALAWLDERRLRLKDTRRLQLAAKQGGTLGCLFRPAEASEQASMAELRLGLAPTAPDELAISIVKRRGGWPLAGIKVPVAHEVKTQDVQERLASWRRSRHQHSRTQQASEDPPFHLNPELRPELKPELEPALEAVLKPVAVDDRVTH